MTISAERVKGLGTPFFPDRWEVIFPLIPGQSGETSTFSARARGTQLPGYSVETAEVWFKGKRTTHATRVAESGELTITFEEGINLPVWKAFQAWKALCETRNRILYQTVLVLNVQDSADNNKAQITLGNVFPVDVPDVPLDMDNSSIVNIDIRFRYDWAELTG